MVIHFGINPVRGGSPPNDRRRIGSKILSWGEFSIIFLIFILWFMDFSGRVWRLGQ